MSTQTLKEGLDKSLSVHNKINGFFSSLRLLISAPLVYIALPLSIIYPLTPPSTIDTSQIQHEVLLTHDALVVKRVKSAIVITPGISNAEEEARARHAAQQKKLEQLATLTGISLRSIDIDLLDTEIERFLTSVGSPLAMHAEDFVDAGLEYAMDPRILVGISGIESSFGMHLITYTHNPFGLGPNLVFSSYREAIFAEAAFLRRNFYDRGLTSPYEIGPRYTGTGSTTWGPAVARFMESI